MERNLRIDIKGPVEVNKIELAQRILDMLNSGEDLFGADVVRCYTGNSAGSILQFEVRK